MAKLKKSDFRDEQEFLERLRDVLIRHGVGSSEANQLMAVAAEDDNWRRDAEEMRGHRQTIEGLRSPADQVAVPAAVNQGVWLATFRLLTRFIRPAIVSTRLQGILIGLVTTLGGVVGLQQLAPKSPAPRDGEVNVTVNTPATKEKGEGATTAPDTRKLADAIAASRAEVETAGKNARDAITKGQGAVETASGAAQAAIKQSQADVQSAADAATREITKGQETVSNAAGAAGDAIKKSQGAVESAADAATKKIEALAKDDTVKAELKAKVGEVIDTPEALGKLKTKSAEHVDMDFVFNEVVKRFEASKEASKKVVDKANSQ